MTESLALWKAPGGKEVMVPAGALTVGGRGSEMVTVEA
jgi:hypothetical protein